MGWWKDYTNAMEYGSNLAYIFVHVKGRYEFLGKIINMTKQ